MSIKCNKIGVINKESKMATITVSIRMEEDLKQNFENFCDDIGMTMSTAMNVFARQSLRENRIPFEISSDETPNERTIAAMKEGEEIMAGKRPAKRHHSFRGVLEEALNEK